MKSILIQNGRILDPSTGRDEICDLFLRDGRICDLKKVCEKEEEKTSSDTKPAAAEEQAKADIVLDASGCFVMPGLIDLHVHFRDPGLTQKEDIISGSKAAAKGGFTTVVAMPNTKPVMDTPDRVAYVRNKAASAAPIHVLQAGAITAGQKGEVLSDIEGMVKEGIPAISEDGKSVMNGAVYLEGMKKAAALGIPVLAHCEDKNLVRGGCVNEDENTKVFGYKGINNIAEDVIVARDILLASEAGAHLHLCHCSTKGSAELLKIAKERGLRVTGEVCPHHFAMTSAQIRPGNTNYKMNPPLRTEEDRMALIRGLADGTFDVISTDHAPHTNKEKDTTMEEAPFGIVGLETSVALTLTELVDKGYLTPLQMAEKMSYNPAKVLGLSDRGSLKDGMLADVVIIDPEKEYSVNIHTFVSKSRNCPYHGRKVKGEVVCTICEGEIVYQRS